MSELQCVSKDFTKIVKLNRQKFISVMQNDEKDFELFCQIRDNIQYYDNLREIGETCRNCNNKSHSSLQCPRVHFDKRSEFIRIGVIESKKQSRNEKKRRKYKLNSLNIINHISYVAAEFMNDFQFKYLESALKTETKLGEEEISNKLSDQYSQNFTSILRSEVRHEDFVPTDSTKQNFLSKFKQQTQPILESSLLITQHSQDKTLDEQISLKFLNLSKFTKQLSRQSNENELSSVIEVESSNRQIQEGSSKLEEEQWNDEINFNKSKEQINLKQQQVLQNKYKKKTSTQCFDQRFVSFMDQHANSYEQKDTIFLSPYQIQQNSLSNSFPWNFETQKDFKFYFTQGNLKYLLLRIQKAQIKYLKKKAKKKLKF